MDLSRRRRADGSSEPSAGVHLARNDSHAALGCRRDGRIGRGLLERAETDLDGAERWVPQTHKYVFWRFARHTPIPKLALLP
jgi:hypothetical protein